MSPKKLLITSGIMTLVAHAAMATTFSFGDHQLVILESFLGDFASDAPRPTINNHGTVLFYDRNRIQPNSAPEYVTVDIKGRETSRISAPTGQFLRGGVINDNGQIVAQIIDENLAISNRSLVLIDPDGTITELMRISPLGDPDASLRQLAEFQVNSSGEVAFSGTSLGNVGVVGKVSPGVKPVLLDQDIPGTGGRNVTNEVDITDDGIVTWFAQDQGDRGTIVASDGVSDFKVILTTPNSQTQLLPEHATNNAGQVLGSISGFGTIGPTVILGNGFESPGYDSQAFSSVQTLTESPFPFVQGIAVNEFGQLLVRNGDDASIYLDGERIIGEGDLIGIGELIDLARGGAPTRFVSGASLNNLGQVVFEAVSAVRGSLPGTISNTESMVIRVDPRGATPNHVVLPTNVSGAVNAFSLNIVNDLGITAPLYVDPVIASGFQYQLPTGMPNFLSLIIPKQDLGGDSLFEVMFDNFVTSLGFDEHLDFDSYLTGGVSSFTIRGVGHEAARTTDDPFVVGLTFAERGRIDFTITGLSGDPVAPSPIPLPAGGYLLIGGLIALAVLRRRGEPSGVCGRL